MLSHTNFFMQLWIIFKAKTNHFGPKDYKVQWRFAINFANR